jgi:hypothetical protein
MGTLGEETLALRVDEATMQEWLAAVTMIQFAPPSTYSTTPLDSHPERVERARVRRSTTGRRPPPQPVPTGVAGARSAYWIGLALAVGLLAFL